MDMNRAKSTLGFSPSTCIDEITDEKLHTKFTQKLVEADSENTRMIHEAYQFLTAKKKKKSGRSMVQNWGKVGGKAMLLGAANKAQAEPAQEEQK